MRAKSGLAHLPEHEAERLHNRTLNDALKAATEEQRSRLRPTSINPSNQVHYDQQRKRPAPEQLARPRAKRRRADVKLPSRLAAIRTLLKHRTMDRYDVEAWDKFLKKNVAALKPVYPRSTASNCAFARPC